MDLIISNLAIRFFIVLTEDVSVHSRIFYGISLISYLSQLSYPIPRHILYQETTNLAMKHLLPYILAPILRIMGTICFTYLFNH